MLGPLEALLPGLLGRGIGMGPMGMMGGHPMGGRVVGGHRCVVESGEYRGIY